MSGHVKIFHCVQNSSRKPRGHAARDFTRRACRKISIFEGMVTRSGLPRKISSTWLATWPEGLYVVEMSSYELESKKLF